MNSGTIWRCYQSSAFSWTPFRIRPAVWLQSREETWASIPPVQGGSAKQHLVAKKRGPRRDCGKQQKTCSGSPSSQEARVAPDREGTFAPPLMAGMGVMGGRRYRPMRQMRRPMLCAPWRVSKSRRCRSMPSAVILLGEANKILDAALGDEAALRRSAQDWNLSPPEARDRQNEGTIVSQPNWVTVRTDDGRAAHARYVLSSRTTWPRFRKGLGRPCC